MEQDVIGHLIDVERSAFDMMMDAQNEADKRKTAAREEAEYKFRLEYEKIIKELETSLEEEKKKCDAEQEAEYTALASRLSAVTLDKKAFSDHLESLFNGV